jgi:hypothetical protein
MNYFASRLAELSGILFIGNGVVAALQPQAGSPSQDKI